MESVKLDFYCSLRAAHLSAKYAAVRFYLDWFVSDNVEFCTSHTYIGDDWKQRRKVNQSMPKATLRGAYDEKEKKERLTPSTSRDRIVAGPEQSQPHSPFYASFRVFIYTALFTFRISRERTPGIKRLEEPQI